MYTRPGCGKVVDLRKVVRQAALLAFHGLGQLHDDGLGEVARLCLEGLVEGEVSVNDKLRLAVLRPPSAANRRVEAAKAGRRLHPATAHAAEQTDQPANRVAFVGGQRVRSRLRTWVNCFFWRPLPLDP